MRLNEDKVWSKTIIIKLSYENKSVLKHLLEKYANFLIPNVLTDSAIWVFNYLRSLTVI